MSTLLQHLCIVVFLVINFSYTKCAPSDHHNEYLHEWAVQVRDSDEADLIALETGFRNEGPVSIYFFNVLSSYIFIINFNLFEIDPAI